MGKVSSINNAKIYQQVLNCPCVGTTMGSAIYAAGFAELFLQVDYYTPDTTASFGELMFYAQLVEGVVPTPGVAPKAKFETLGCSTSDPHFVLNSAVDGDLPGSVLTRPLVGDRLMINGPDVSMQEILVMRDVPYVIYPYYVTDSSPHSGNRIIVTAYTSF